MNDFLAVVAYPNISEKDKAWIDAYRKENDVYYNLIGAHFTFVFPIENYGIDLLTREVKIQSENQKPINFSIRCATRNNDLTSDLWHVLLVPDKGFSDVVRLHDKLYSGTLADYERLDLDFIPHIGIANSPDPKKCKRMVDEINAQYKEIMGIIDTLDLVEYKNGSLQTFHQIQLKK